VFSDCQFVIFSGAALNGRTRRLIIGQSLDDYETKQVHPLWHSWLNHRGELPSEQVSHFPLSLLSFSITLNVCFVCCRTLKNTIVSKHW
jgi:hypothetical protein